MNVGKTVMEVPAGWIDLQVNGFMGVDFSAPGLRLEDVRRVTKALVQRGTGAYCPTVITNEPWMYEVNLGVLAAAMESPTPCRATPTRSGPSWLMTGWSGCSSRTGIICRRILCGWPCGPRVLKTWW
jgi:hypothetical protein